MHRVFNGIVVGAYKLFFGKSCEKETRNYSDNWILLFWSFEILRSLYSSTKLFENLQTFLSNELKSLNFQMTKK